RMRRPRRARGTALARAGPTRRSMPTCRAGTGGVSRSGFRHSESRHEPGETMKLMRLGARGQEKPAVWASDHEAIDVSSIVPDFDPPFFAQGGVERVRAAVAEGKLPKIKTDGVRIGAPLVRPGNLMAVGKNYAEHAKETNSAVPEKPLIFVKATSSIN